eukprot:TRINITY_DN52259_c0_g2_i1.p1 TRINITY_DN52259_c0_g2~~TRINITY_DN52259_c0_g2_i1.p1  ORF type:complete len:396 (-),score=50.67 TRINITY_DN52259_c0_g2_i1:135-1250(-)
MADQGGQARGHGGAQYGAADASPRSPLHSDEFLAVLRHLNEARAREASILSRRGRSREQASKELLPVYGSAGLFRRTSARAQWALRCVQDFHKTLSLLICLLVFKVALHTVNLLRTSLWFLLLWYQDGRVGRLTSLQWWLTNTVIQLQGLQHEKRSRAKLVTEFVARHSISMPVSLRIRKYIERSQLMERPEAALEALRRQCTELLVDIQEEMRIPTLVPHPFFATLRTTHPQLVREMCLEAILPVLTGPNEMVFDATEASAMYFVINGHVMYTGHFKDPDCSGAISQIWRTLHGGQWLAEAALWTSWIHRGKLRTITDCFLLELCAAGFARVISTHKSAHQSAAIYARRFVERLNLGPQTDVAEAASVDD